MSPLPALGTHDHPLQLPLSRLTEPEEYILFKKKNPKSFQSRRLIFRQGDKISLHLLYDYQSRGKPQDHGHSASVKRIRGEEEVM